MLDEFGGVCTAQDREDGRGPGQARRAAVDATAAAAALHLSAESSLADIVTALAAEAAEAFDLRVFGGGHFFLGEHTAEVADVVRGVLRC